MKTIKAIFKGADNSLGYKTDKEYTLIIHHKIDSFILIEDVKGSRRCEYSSILTFLDNWDDIRLV